MITFTQDGTQYDLITTLCAEDRRTVTVREHATGLFVKSWECVSPEKAASLASIAEGGGRVVLKSDLKALAVLEYIEKYVAHHGVPPRRRDIESALSLNGSEVLIIMNRLVDIGFIIRPTYKTRGIQLMKRRADR